MTLICSICLEKCANPAILQLKCKCEYTVHYKCYKEWWDMHKTCIICKIKAKKIPLPSDLLGKKTKKTKKLKELKDSCIKYGRSYNKYLDGVPSNLENNLLGFFLSVILIYLYYSFCSHYIWLQLS